MSAIHDPLQLDLDGIRVVEASAGTGKTFTIATLYLRLILERDFKAEDIVVATFTRAAAAELSERLRGRLVIADGLLSVNDPATPHDDDDGETRETRRLIARALQSGATVDALRERARTARQTIDAAFIGTLHGFCHRALAEFGFETGQALRPPELVDDIRTLQMEIVRDFWRRGSADAATARWLAETWGAPDALARQVRDPRWRGREVELPEIDAGALERERAALRSRIAGWTDAALVEADQEIGECFSHASARRPRCAALRMLRDWAADEAADASRDAKALVEAGRFDPDANAKLASFQRQPNGVVFETLQRLRATLESLLHAREVAQTLPAARLLRDARAFAESELPKRLAERNLMGHDQAVDRLAAALADPGRGVRIAARIRARWKAALVDEFQDTDAQQWRVVEKLFGPATLVLVGDPKQAIYGFRGGDVFAWLQACEEARRQSGGDDTSLRLRDSHRSGEGMCRATNALFSTPGAFVEAGIEHPDIRAAKPKRALLRDGVPVAALQWWWLDPGRIEHAADRLPSKEQARHAIQQACVAWIVRMLNDRAVELRDGHGHTERLQPRHIAVLVNSNAEALAMQAALGRAGIAAASNLRASVYASDEAADLALLLAALAAPDDARCARAARASVLIGDDAATIAAGIDDDARQAMLLEGIAAWADAVRRNGPLPWLHHLLETAAPRLLALPDGERRVANHLQLAELLQVLHAQSFGLEDLAVRFARARMDAAGDDDAARLRLDTDADAVTLSTLHAAKGLEYDVVLVPYAVLGQDPGGNRNRQPALCWYHEGNRAHVAIGDGADEAIIEKAKREALAEDVRKFYVAVTRARALCVLPYGPTSSTRFSAAFHLLHEAGRAAQDRLADDVSGCRRALDALCERADGAAEVIDLPALVVHGRQAPREPAPTLHARAFTRTTLEREWQTWSFSRLVRGSGNQAVHDPLPGSGDADALLVDDATHDAGLAGARFGTAVHAVFERTDFAAWRDAAGVPESERALIESSLREQGLADAGHAAMQRAVAVAGACIRDALNAPLPCDARLCDVLSTRRKAEIEFHLALQPAHSSALYALLHRHGYQAQRSGVAPHVLDGLLTGKVDLTFLHAGRFHIVDWKTNRCAPYDAAAMRAEIAAHDYDLQWLIYTLALHRWLRQRLPDYDYARHVGDAYYLFVRGMHDGRGIHADRPPRELIEAMDALFQANVEDKA